MTLYKGSWKNKPRKRPDMTTKHEPGLREKPSTQVVPWRNKGLSSGGRHFKTRYLVFFLIQCVISGIPTFWSFGLVRWKKSHNYHLGSLTLKSTGLRNTVPVLRKFRRANNCHLAKATKPTSVTCAHCSSKSARTLGQFLAAVDNPTYNSCCDM